RGEFPKPPVIATDDACAYTANYGKFWLHANVPGHRRWLDYGDSHTLTSPGHAVNQAFAYYAALYQRQGQHLEAGVSQWLRRGRLEYNGDFESWTAFHSLWYQDGLKAISREGKDPLHAHFRGAGRSTPSMI